MRNQSLGAERLHVQVSGGVVGLASGPWKDLAPDGAPGDEYRLSRSPTSPPAARPSWLSLQFTPRDRGSPEVRYATLTLVLSGAGAPPTGPGGAP